MPIYALGSLEPAIHPDAYVHPDATVIGDVRIGAHASVWPQTVLRGDHGHIEIGERSNVQDGCVLHCTERHPTILGPSSAVGHAVHIEGATIGTGCLIASGSVVLNGSVIEDGGMVGAGAVLSYGSHVKPARSRWACRGRRGRTRRSARKTSRSSSIPTSGGRSGSARSCDGSTRAGDAGHAR